MSRLYVTLTIYGFTPATVWGTMAPSMGCQDVTHICRHFKNFSSVPLVRH